jgi:hypothetical protein
MMVALLLHAYAIGERSSRRIERRRATRELAQNGACDKRRDQPAGEPRRR